METLDVAQHDEEVRLDERGGERREVVVVAELELFHGHRVILVHDRDDAEVEERPQRVSGVQVAAAVGQVRVGEEHLGDDPLVGGEGTLVGGHEPDLPDGRGCLAPLDAVAARAEPGGAGGDGARGDDHELPSPGDERRDLPRQRPHALAPEALRARQHVAPDLDDRAAHVPEEARLVRELVLAAHRRSLLTPALPGPRRPPRLRLDGRGRRRRPRA